MLIVRIGLQVRANVALGVNHASAFGHKCQVVRVYDVSLRRLHYWPQFKTYATFTNSILHEFGFEVK